MQLNPTFNAVKKFGEKKFFKKGVDKIKVQLINENFSQTALFIFLDCIAAAENNFKSPKKIFWDRG